MNRRYWLLTLFQVHCVCACSSLFDYRSLTVAFDKKRYYCRSLIGTQIERIKKNQNSKIIIYRRNVLMTTNCLSLIKVQLIEYLCFHLSTEIVYDCTSKIKVLLSKSCKNNRTSDCYKRSICHILYSTLFNAVFSLSKTVQFSDSVVVWTIFVSQILKIIAFTNFVTYKKHVVTNRVFIYWNFHLVTFL